jgi:hypothetical protein
VVGSSVGSSSKKRRSSTPSPAVAKLGGSDKPTANYQTNLGRGVWEVWEASKQVRCPRSSKEKRGRLPRLTALITGLAITKAPYLPDLPDRTPGFKPRLPNPEPNALVHRSTCLPSSTAFLGTTDDRTRASPKDRETSRTNSARGRRSRPQTASEARAASAAGKN